MGKLTLHVPDALVAAAKREAAQRRTSVSKLVSDYFRVLGAGSVVGVDSGPLPPATAALVGCLKGSTGDRKSHIDYLEKKHS